MDAPGGIFFDEFHNVRIMDTELCKQTEDLQARLPRRRRRRRRRRRIFIARSSCTHCPAGPVRRIPRAHAVVQRQRRITDRDHVKGERLRARWFATARHTSGRMATWLSRRS